MTPAALGPTLVGILALCAVSVGVLSLARIPQWWAPFTAVARAAVQLAAIGLILSGVITDIVWVALALLVMLSVAIATSTHRLGWSTRHVLVVASAIVGGAAATLLVVFGSGALAPTPRYLLAIGGIVIGNTMAITTLTARRFLQAVGEQWDQVEGWLALGAGPVDATRALARSAVHAALVPSIDQTKTTGLVTLPGAFVGAVFGGLSPLEAGRFQVVVLAAILTAGTIAAVLVVRLLGDVQRRPLGP
ncbi:ABC transporter permease [uncultured Amnibacterium sp.]|uniref:ABC transporter permease n=1 Tax=uncultured Amnibacterium sp. TaxID=1631851 RepID=UPI0035CC34EE